MIDVPDLAQQFDRCFLGIAVPEPSQQALLRIQQRLGQANRIAWVPAQKLHLTLKFLGQTSRAMQEDLAERLRQTSSGTPPFHLELKGLGVFHRRQFVSVVWAGLAGQVDRLLALREDVELATIECGFPASDFTPHITLGRARQGIRRHSEIERSILAAGTEVAGAFEVNQFTLFRSAGGYEAAAVFGLH